MVCWIIDLYLSTNPTFILLSKSFVLFRLPDIFARKRRIIDEIESNFFFPLSSTRSNPKECSRVQNKRRRKKNIPLHDLWRQNLDKYPPLVYTPRKNASGIDARIRDIERRGVDSCGSGGQKRGRERLNASRRIEGKEGGRKEENGGESKLAR